MNEPLDITIINTVYFHTDKVEKCFDSLFENTKYPFKLVVVVNGADKDLTIYLKELERKPNVTMLWNKKNPGPAASENDGIKLAKTKYIVITHTDMMFQRGWLTALVDCWNNMENPGYIFPTNRMGDCHVNFHPLMEREKYWSVERDPAFKRAYSDFDWYWKFQKLWPNLCSYVCKESIIYHECGGIRHANDITGEDKRLMAEDAKRYYKRWGVDAVNSYGAPIWKPEFLEHHKCAWEECSCVQPIVLSGGQMSSHYYECRYCHDKKHFTDTLFFKYCHP